VDQALPTIGLLAFVYAGMNLLKYLTNGKWKSAVTLVVAWAVGVAAVVVYASSDWAAAQVFNDVPLDQLNGASQVIAGVLIGSGASAFIDTIGSFDNSISNEKTKLIP
jgi:hypothetical protein